jgi:hypothetical protein
MQRESLILQGLSGGQARHVVIVENVEHKGAFVRALISRRRLIRQLGLD